MSLRWKLSLLLVCCFMFGSLASIMTPKQANAASPCTAPVPDLVDLDFNTSMTDDKSATNNDGVAVGSPSLVFDTQVGKNVLKLNGSSQYIKLPHVAAYNTQRVTMMVQFKADADSFGSLRDPFAKNQSSDYGFEITTGKQLTSYLSLKSTTGGTSGSYKNTSYSNIQGDKYYDVAITYDGLKHVMYMNGQYVTETAFTGFIHNSSTINLHVGSDPQPSNGAQSYFKGSIGYAKLFSKGLSAAELACYYESTGILADQQAPSWPAGSLLAGAQTSSTSYTVSWPTAIDDKAVTQYRLYKNGTLLDTVSSSINSYDFTHVFPGEVATFKVEAGDAAGNWTTTGPSLSYTMPGVVWPVDGALTVTPQSLTSTVLLWPAAFDESVISQYRVYLDGTVLTTVPSTQHNAILEAIPPGSTHAIQVEAGTSSGLWAATRLSTSFTMTGSPADIIAPAGMMPDLLQLTFENGVGYDSSEAHNNGTPVGSAQVVDNPDFTKKVLQLDGNSSYVRIPMNPGLSPSYMTMAASFSLDDMYRTQDIIGKAQHSDYALEYNPITRKLEAWFFIHDIFGKESYVIVPSSTLLTEGQIYDAEATFDGQTAKLYLNGILEGSQSKVGVIGGATKVDLTIGADAEPIGAQSYFQGKIGFVELYSKVLDANAVQQLHTKYAPTGTPTVSSISWDIPSEWWVGQSAAAVVKKTDANSVVSVIDNGLAFQSMNPTIAEVSTAGVITPLRAGTATLTASYGSLRAYVTITVRNKVLPKPQSLLLNGPSVIVEGETEQTVTTVVYEDGSTGVMSDGLTYSSEQPTIATIDNNGIIRAISPGIAVLSAVGEGLRADFILTVISANHPIEGPQITALKFSGPTTLTVGESGNTVLTAVYSDNSTKPLESGVTYWSDAPNIVRVDSVTGAVYAAQPGSTRLVAQYQGLNASFSLAVIAGSEPVDPTPSENQPQVLLINVPSILYKGESAAITASAVYVDGVSKTSVWVTGIAKWLAVNPDIVKVDPLGTITGLRLGTTVVTATYQNLVSQTTITVLEQVGDTPSDTSYSHPDETPSIELSHKVVDLQQQLAANGTIQVANRINEIVFPSLAERISNNQSISLDRGDLILRLPGNLFIGSTDSKLVLGLTAGTEMEQTAWLQSTITTKDTKLKFASSIFDLSIATQDVDGIKTPKSQWIGPIQAEFTVSGDKPLLGVYRIFDDGSMSYVGGELTEKGMRAALQENGKYAVLEYKKTYQDLPEQHWANRTVQVMSAMHMVEGVSDAFFQPEKSITRAEFVALLMKSMHLPQQGQSSFKDVPASAWYAPYVAGAAASGLVNGEDDLTFKPESVMSREEMAVFLARVFEHKGGKLAQSSDSDKTFQDADQMAEWARPSIELAAKLGLLQGRSEQRFVPTGNVSRAEAAQAVFNLIHTLVQ